MDSVALTNPESFDRINLVFIADFFVVLCSQGRACSFFTYQLFRGIVTRKIRPRNRAFLRVARIAMISVRAPRTRSFLTYFRLSSVGPALRSASPLPLLFSWRLFHSELKLITINI